MVIYLFVKNIWNLAIKSKKKLKKWVFKKEYLRGLVPKLICSWARTCR